MSCSRFFISSLLLLCLAACGPDEGCHVSTGDARCELRPYGDARLVSLSHVGGYVYLTGGHRGVVVLHTGLNDFVAYERTCPCDDSSRVEISRDWGSSVLECPRCHSCFDPLNFGMPFDGSATSCALYQYSTYFDGTLLHIY